MSGEADTIRDALTAMPPYGLKPNGEQVSPAKQKIIAALDVLVAENERYRDALERIGSQSLGHSADNACVVVARAALAGGGDA